MTSTCPDGHVSATSDFCDQCGRPIGPAPAQPTEILEAVEDTDTSRSTSPAAQREECPVCATERSGKAPFCEACGYDFSEPAPAAAAWEAIVQADREWFERSASGAPFPAAFRQQRVALDQRSIRIGRRRDNGDEPPEIALVDPGASRKHAVLERQGDGTYAVTDLGSTNGTYINDSADPIVENEAVRLVSNDRIRLGAWTSITVRSQSTT
jgi:hypothetical protein